MSELEIKNIFSRFQNLNLRILVDDLKNGQCAVGDWVHLTKDSKTWENITLICPLAHGFHHESSINKVQLALLSQQEQKIASEEIGITRKQVKDFLNWYDYKNDSTNKLLPILESIWKERLEDADAVQNVITESEVVCSY